MDWSRVLSRESEDIYIIPRSTVPGMRTRGRIYASERMLPDIIRDSALGLSLIHI